MSSAPNPEGVPPGAPFVPQGPVPAVGVPNSQDYPRLVYTAPRFEVVAIADIIEPSVLEACEALLPTLVPPYVNQAAIDAVNATAVRRAGDTMTGPLNLSPVIPTADAMAASKQYVDTMIATGAVPEVPPVPAGQAWARETGQWVPIAGGGTVTNIATGAGLTGGPITATGIISMANMAGNTLKGNNTGAVAAPTDLNVGQVMAMLGAAPLNSPTFTGSPSLPTGTAAVTQPGGTSDTTVATTAFVASSLAAQLISPAFTGNPTAPTPAPGDNDTSIATTAFVATSFAPLASPVFTGAPSLPTGTVAVTQTAGTANTSLATTAFVGAAITASTANYLPLTGGRLSGGLASGPAATAVPGPGALTLNANTVAPPATTIGGVQEWVVGANNTNALVMLDAFGTTGSNAIPAVQFRRARGTAAAQSAVQTGDYLGLIEAQGYAASAYANTGAIALNFVASENWTATANGSQLNIQTTPAGATGSVNSLQLAGNTATFANDIVTSAGATFYFGPVATNTCRLNANATTMYLTADAFYGYNRANTNTWYIDTSSNLLIAGSTGQKASGTTWANPSSRALKQNIQPYEAGLQAVLALQPRTYEFSAASGIEAPGPHIGLIHDETSHMPEMHRTLTLGSGEAAREVDGLDCSAVTWALVNAIKELKAEIDALKAGRTA